MYSKVAILLALALSVSGCMDRDYFKGEVRLVAQDPPSLVAPAVYASANLRDILIKGDQERASVLQVDEKGVLKLHKRLESVYRANLLELILPKKREYRTQVQWRVPHMTQSGSAAMMAEEVQLPVQEGEFVLNLPEKVVSIDRLTWSCRAKLSIPDLPVHMSYSLELPEIKDENNRPLRVEWRTDEGSGELDKLLPRLSLEKKKGSAIALRYRLSARTLGTKRPGEDLPRQITVDLALSELDVFKFEGKLSNTIDIKPKKPITFAYSEWDDLEDLAIQGSSLELDLKYRGKMGFSTKPTSA